MKGVLSLYLKLVNFFSDHIEIIKLMIVVKLEIMICTSAGSSETMCNRLDL